MCNHSHAVVVQLPWMHAYLSNYCQYLSKCQQICTYLIFIMDKYWLICCVTFINYINQFIWKMSKQWQIYIYNFKWFTWLLSIQFFKHIKHPLLMCKKNQLPSTLKNVQPPTPCTHVLYTQIQLFFNIFHLWHLFKKNIASEAWKRLSTALHAVIENKSNSLFVPNVLFNFPFPTPSIKEPLP